MTDQSNQIVAEMQVRKSRRQKEAFRAWLCGELEAAGRDVQVVRGFSLYPSDNANFKKGAGVCALKHKKVVGYYMDRIHTGRDTVLDEANIALLRDGCLRYAAALD